jgi:hypothetical protein
LNVIGADRPWRAARQTLFVLKGDVGGAGAILQDPVAGMSFPAFFAEAVAEACRDLVIVQATKGDSALLVDRPPKAAGCCRVTRHASGSIKPPTA